jgi:hypothetical protein
MEIRDATPEDADEVCEVLRRSIIELRAADHRNDPDPAQMKARIAKIAALAPKYRTELLGP